MSLSRWIRRRVTRRAEFPATAAGYVRLLGWLSEFGAVCLVGIEGTGSYGAGLARTSPRPASRSSRWIVPTARTGAGREVDPLDAVSARGRRSPAGPRRAKGRDGAVEAIRALMVAKRSARAERTETINQAGP